MRIVLLQSRTDPEHITEERENFERVIGDAAKLECISTLDEKLAWTSPAELLQGVSGVMLGGSADFDFHGGRPEGDPVRLASMVILARAQNIVSYALTVNLPILGVCFGHQLIAEMYGGRIHNDKTQGKFGPHRVLLTEAALTDPLFSHLPQSFVAQYAHKDSVTVLPRGATLLGTGPSCRFSALRYGPKLYTVQFHPESRQPIPPEFNSQEAKRIPSLWIEHIVRRGDDEI